MTSSAEPPVQTIAVVGLGLIGGSIALAVRERWPSIRLVGLDRPAVLAHALGSGAIETAASSLADLRRAELVILAAPVTQNLALLRELAGQVDPATLVTDVGGTKRDIVEASRAVATAFRFVGGHPIGGAERGGFAFARPDLFADRPWIFTPDGEAAGPALETLQAFARGLGARPAVLEAAQHDHLMAYLSHLPQLAASALMEVAGRSAGSDGLRLAGRGLVDSTRLASSPADVWRDICASNAGAIGEALDALIARLTELRAHLADGDAVDAAFDGAGRWRAELMKGRD